jgi:hypothetical protein
MTAIDFPDTPTIGDTFTAGDFTWEWNGTVWKSVTIGPHATSHEDSGVDEIEIAQSQVTGLSTSLAEKAPISSPTFTGTIIGAPAEPDTNANTAKNLGYVGLPQVILNSGNLTLSKAHSGEHIYVTGASQTITIPANASVPLEIGTTIVIINANVTSSIAITTDTLRLAGTATTGTRALAAYGMATLIKIAATTWIASGNGLT